MWLSWCLQPSGKEDTRAAEGAMKPEALVLRDDGCQKEYLAPFQALALVVLLTLWSVPSPVPTQLLAGFWLDFWGSCSPEVALGLCAFLVAISCWVNPLWLLKL